MAEERKMDKKERRPRPTALCPQCGGKLEMALLENRPCCEKEIQRLEMDTRPRPASYEQVPRR